MTKIKVEYKIDYLNESNLNSLCNLFDGFEASWKICEDVIPLSLEITSIMNKESSTVVVSFEGDLQCDVNIAKNGIYNLHFEKDDVFKTKTRYELGIYHLEEYFENEINYNTPAFTLSRISFFSLQSFAII